MRNLKKRILACFFAVAMILTLLPGSVFAADDYGPVQYLDKDQNVQTCSTYGLIDENTSTISVEYSVAFGEVVINHHVEISGNIKLILTDGCKLAIKGGISIPKGSSLTIYAQSTSEETMGKLEANAEDNDGKAGIEVNSESQGLTICGGNISAVGGGYAAGIGGNEKGNSGNITVYGGKVYAEGGWRDGAGIGGGSQGDCKNVTICGGNVSAIGGSYGAGIGGGYEGDSVDTITISGGRVYAEGGSFSAGIGGGYYGNANVIKITGGETEAIGREGGSGIGGGKEAQFGTGGEFEEFIFTGGKVSASATPYVDSIIGKAIGEGHGGDDNVKYTVPLGNDHILVDNETGKLVDIGFYSDVSRVMHDYGKNRNCDLTFISTSEWPVSYLTQNIYGETITEECKENYKFLYYNENNTLELTSGWYVMKGEGTYENGVEIKGDVHLILTDGCTLTVRNGIRIGAGAELTVYGQSEGETAGKLNSYGTYYRAGIGGSGNSRDGGSCGKLTIRGGNVIADGSYNDGAGACAGVGGICDQPGIKPVELSMYGGVLTAVGRYGSAGIGGCRKAPGGIVNIYGGTINAESRNHGYPSMTNRAIGGYKDNPDNGTVYVGKDVVLIDNKTGKQITKAPGEEWIDKFAAENISVTATRDMPPVSYLYYDEETGNYETGTCEEYFRPEYNLNEWESGWYVVNDECTYNQTISVNGDVHLILTDGCKLNASYGIVIQKDASLSIYSQSTGDNMGELEAYRTQSGDSADGKSGIWTIGPLFVHGGKVSATGGYRGAGIGGGCQIVGTLGQPGGNVTVYDGIVTAKGGTYGAGIGGGGGHNGDGGTLNVYGGSVTAEGGYYAAGIGGGYNEHGGFISPERSGKGGILNLYGGRVMAIGGTKAPHGIGGAMEATSNGTINVKEGCIIIDNNTGEKIKNEDGKPWVEILTGEAVNISVENNVKPEVDDIYKIIYGSNSEWTKNSKSDLTITSDAPFDKFWCVMVDGAVINEENYIVKEGSTNVTLKESYLNTLSVGKHTMSIVSYDGKAATYFMINAKNENPDTGDNTNLMWMMIVLIGSVFTLAAAGLSLRKLKK